MSGSARQFLARLRAGIIPGTGVYLLDEGRFEKHQATVEPSARGQLAETRRVHQFLLKLPEEVVSLLAAEPEEVLRKFGVDCVAFSKVTDHQDLCETAAHAQSHAERLLKGWSATQTGSWAGVPVEDCPGVWSRERWPGQLPSEGGQDWRANPEWCIRHPGSNGQQIGGTPSSANWLVSASGVSTARSVPLRCSKNGGLGLQRQNVPNQTELDRPEEGQLPSEGGQDWRASPTWCIRHPGSLGQHVGRTPCSANRPVSASGVGTARVAPLQRSERAGGLGLQQQDETKQTGLGRPEEVPLLGVPPGLAPVRVAPGAAGSVSPPWVESPVYRPPHSPSQYYGQDVPVVAQPSEAVINEAVTNKAVINEAVTNKAVINEAVTMAVCLERLVEAKEWFETPGHDREPEWLHAMEMPDRISFMDALETLTGNLPRVSHAPVRYDRQPPVPPAPRLRDEDAMPACQPDKHSYWRRSRQQ